MDISKLESFLTLVKTKNFAKASDRLYISQPALSKRIQSLEQELDAPLFNRIGNHNFLTLQGEAFQKFAEEMVATYYRARKYLEQIENMEHGTLSFGATNFIGVYLMPKIIELFSKRYPNIQINMIINSSQNILEMLHRNQLEFIFLSDYVLTSPENYVNKAITEDCLKLVVGNRHPLFGKTKCNLQDVKDDVYITKKAQSSQYKFLKDVFHDYHFDFERKLIISMQEAIKECVVHNIGISIMSERMVEREVAAGLLTAMDFCDKPVKRNIECVYIQNKLLTPAAKEFMRYSEKMYANASL